MTVEQRDKYAYELMVKNNPEEAVKQLLLKDKVIEEIQQRIDKAIKLLKEDYFEDGSGNNVEEVIKILKGGGINAHNSNNKSIKPTIR